MNSNHRQVIILFDLLSQNIPLSYEHFIDILEVTKRTIREDIKALNDKYKDEIQIAFKKNSGFYVIGSQQKKNEIIDKMKMNYADIFDVGLKPAKNNQIILRQLINANDYVKVCQLTDLLYVNKRIITNSLTNIRKTLKEYQLEIKSRPHYGMYIYGQESKYRCCSMKVIYDSYNQMENNIAFETNDRKQYLNDIEKAIIEYFLEINAEIDQLSSFRLATMISASYQRIIKKHEVEYNEEQKELIKHLEKDIDISSLIIKLENILDLKYSINEKNWILIYMLICSPELLRRYENIIYDSKTEAIINDVIQVLNEIKIINENNFNIFLTYLKTNTIRLYITALFGIYDNCYGASSVKTITKSALSNVITQRIVACVEKTMNFTFGITSFVNTAHLVYSMIRNVNNIGKKMKLAVYTPWGKINTNSLKRRIENTYLEVIEKIDTVSFNDLFSDEINDYDFLIYCNCKLPTFNNIKIETFLVDYLFTEEDSVNFYETVVVPSRIYKRAFGVTYIEDYIKNYRFSGLKNLKKQLKSFTDDEYIIKQIDDMKIEMCNFYYGDLTLVVFCKDKSQAFSKLFFLEYYARYGEYKFNRIFFHCICIDYDLIKLKTAEKVIRNIVAYTLTTSVVANDPFIDFYDFYVYDMHNVIGERK